MHDKVVCSSLDFITSVLHVACAADIHHTLTHTGQKNLNAKYTTKHISVYNNFIVASHVVHGPIASSIPARPCE